MSEFSSARLVTILQTLLPTAAAPLCVALSGGLDSIVLLHALAQLRELQQWQVRAVHVDHQLQARSSAWAKVCESWAQQLAIECRVLRVQVQEQETLGVEAAARKARYAALQAELQPNEVLLTAHHADDQFETVLLALLRGSGVAGLAAMPAVARFGMGWHLRPLLSFSRDELNVWAQARHLQFVADPTNEDVRFDRNYLRHEVIPKLTARWPAAAHTGNRSASHLGEAQALLNEYVSDDYSRAASNGSLDADVLRALSRPRRHALLRYWLQQHQVLMPTTRILHALEHDMLQAAEDRVPCTQWQDVAVHRYRDRLYLERHSDAPPLLEMIWLWRNELCLPATLGALCIKESSVRDVHDDARQVRAAQRVSLARLPNELTVRFRQGGERIRLSGEHYHHQLKKLLQESAVLPWWRDRLPLIYVGEELVAVADLWVSAEFAAREGEVGGVLGWQGRPNILA
jgi:tRNA(Ile)-lysidine synthase